jgi:hypothetical protein
MQQQTPQGIPFGDKSQARLFEWFILTKSYSRSWEEETGARADLDADFKNCCMRTGNYDGSLRNHYQR